MDAIKTKAGGGGAPTALNTTFNKLVNNSTSRQIMCFNALRLEVLFSLAILVLPTLAGVLVGLLMSGCAL